ncbi:MAG: hypothetical protein ACFFDS_03850 [Candidatus Thorarchaeota archaeon]
MSDEMNVEWMDEYEITYQKYKEQWDEHYKKVRNFISANRPEKIKRWGFIGVTNTIPEVDTDLLKDVQKFTLLDINEKAMELAEKHLERKLDFEKTELKKFDNTLGYIDDILVILQQYEEGDISEKNLFNRLKEFKHPSIENIPSDFDFITQLGIMDYYLMPVFSKYCERFIHNYDEFYSLLQYLNSEAVKISLKVLHKMLHDDGTLLISTPISREPEGEKCKKSIFWIDSMDDYIEKAGFEINNKSFHIWEEFPLKDGHSHMILNVCCNKKMK